VRISPDQLPDDAPALKQIITAMAQDAIAAQAEIAKLRFQLARYRRAAFGRSSEKLEREAVGVERQRSHRAVVTQAPEVLSIEENVERSDVSRLHNDFLVRLDRLLLRRSQDRFDRKLPVDCDRNPAFVVLTSLQQNRKGTR